MICRVLVVFSFLEDSIRLFLTIDGQMHTMMEVLGRSQMMASASLFFSMFLQFSGAIMVSLKVWPQTGCGFLLAFNFIHPFMYDQFANVEFVLECVSISGGLLILFAHLRLEEAKENGKLPLGGGGSNQDYSTIDIVQAVGRMFLMTVIFYHGVQIIHLNLKNDEHNEDHGLFEYLLDYGMVSVLFVLTSMVVVGLKARWVAFSVAVAWLFFAIYAHPFWIGRYEQFFGEKQFSSHQEIFVEQEQFYFFQSCSTVGALLLLTLYGPGRIAAEQPDKMAMKAFTHKGGD
jgi:uncharacterized membrane protein YphA (DoxX/SURF4 family)